jgi:haloalkane dehalogenase
MANAREDWTFGGLWPYQPRWFETPDGRMHYVDEGPRDGRPVVLVHGNPTWGFLYRNFVGPLVEAGHRAIVPDHLGFGRSDKPARPELYRIPRHVQRLDALLESLDLHDAVVVPDDWGGPIGLSWAVAHPERVSALFILNTYAHGPRGKLKLPLPLRKRHWNTVIIDGSLPDETIRDMIEDSYDLVVSKLPQAGRRALGRRGDA